METIKRFLNSCLFWIVAVLFSLLLVAVVWQVFSRQVLGTPSTWTEEASRMLFVWLGLFAAALVFSERGHIAVDFLVRRMPERAEKYIAMFVQIIVGVFSVVVMIWGGTLIMQTAWTQELSAMPFSFGQMYTALPVAGALFLFYATFNLVGIWRGTVPFYEDIEDTSLLSAVSPVADLNANIEKGS